MTKNDKDTSAGKLVMVALLLINAILLEDAYIKNNDTPWELFFSLPLLAVALKDMIPHVKE